VRRLGAAASRRRSESRLRTTSPTSSTYGFGTEPTNAWAWGTKRCRGRHSMEEPGQPQRVERDGRAYHEPVTGAYDA
jgi:hypothetical protein